MKLSKLLRYIFQAPPKMMFALVMISLVAPNIVMLYTEHTSLLARACSATLPVGIFMLLVSLAKKPGKAFFWLFLFVFFGAFQLVLLDLFGCAPIAVDMFLNLVTTNAVEASELLINMLPVVILVVGYYGLCIALSVISIRNSSTLPIKFARNAQKAGAAISVVGLILLGLCLTTDRHFSFNEDIYPANVTYNVGLAVKRTVLTSKYHETSSQFTFNARSERPDSIKEIHVIVVGETVRADHLGIYGYQRNTTPRLAAIPNLVSFSKALSQSNTTHKSVPMLLSAISAENFNDIYKQKSIITAFKESGYHTIFLSNQRHNHSFIDFFGQEADSCAFIKSDFPIGANVLDGELISRATDAIQSNKCNKLYMVLHTYGSHFNYLERFDENSAVFEPCDYHTADAENRDLLNNAYDNSIVYLDRCLSTLINELNSLPSNVISSVIYIADHGEDIYDDERGLFLHASPIPSYYQLLVPFIAWTSDSYNALYPEKIENLRENCDKPTSTNLVAFHTMLDLAGISSPLFDITNAVSSKNYTPKQYHYVTDHNKAKALEALGLDKQDYQRLKSITNVE